MRKLFCVISICFAFLLAGCNITTNIPIKSKSMNEASYRDAKSPVISGIRDINILLGDDEPDYMYGVTAIDNVDGWLTPSIIVDKSGVDLTTPGTYAVKYSIEDSSGNDTERTINLTVSDRSNFLDDRVLDLLSKLASLVEIKPDPIQITSIGNEVQPSVDINEVTGNRYMNDQEMIYRTELNSVSSKYYFEMIESYNGISCNFNNYFAAILPLVLNITELDKEYTQSGVTLRLTKINDEIYEINGQASISDETVTIKLTIEDVNIVDEYTYKLKLTTEYFEYYYEITRTLLKIKEITKVTKYLGDQIGLLDAIKVSFDHHNNKKIYLYKYASGVDRRLFFDVKEYNTNIYYKNDDTGTEVIQYIDENGLLLFEYEDYQPNVPLIGSQKVRWFLHCSNHWTSIIYHDNLLSDKYKIGGSEIAHNSLFKIEAKEYPIIIVDETTQVMSQVDIATWVYRIEGSYITDEKVLFTLNNIFLFENASQIQTNIDEVYTQTDKYSLFDLDIMLITNEDILNIIRN